jgi:CRP-like cAMP-binding protein
MTTPGSSFTQLTDAERETLFQSVAPRTFRAGEAIITQGALQATMYVLVKGEVKVERHATGDADERPRAKGSEVVHIAELGPGQVFGEMSFLDRAPSSATVTALTDIEVLAIGRAEIDRIAAMDRTFPDRFYQCLAMALVDKLRATSRRLS